MNRTHVHHGHAISRERSAHVWRYFGQVILTFAKKNVVMMIALAAAVITSVIVPPPKVCQMHHHNSF